MTLPALLSFVLLAGAPSSGAQTLAGIDALAADGFRALQGKKVGLITNQTGRDAGGRSTLRVLADAPEVQLKALFAPEHGFTGDVEDQDVSSGTYKLPDGKVLPLYSLYGATKAPTADSLKGLDGLVFDIQDVGARFYTYATTMALAMEAAAKADIEFIVLDRPDPIDGETVEGPILDEGVRHFTAYLPVPVRHGMTIGELARLHNMTAKVGARLSVVSLRGWRRDQGFAETGLRWVRPSPNLPDPEAAELYPGIGCFETANVSVGRGTPVPFRWVGAPWMDAGAVLKRMEAARLPGVVFGTKDLRPSKSVHAGKWCRGLTIRVTDRRKVRPLRVFAHLVCALRDLHPESFGIRFEEMLRMVGTARFEKLYREGAGPKAMIRLFDADAELFKARRAPFLLY